MPDPSDWFTFNALPPRIGMNDSQRSAHQPGTGVAYVPGRDARSLAEVYDMRKVVNQYGIRWVWIPRREPYAGKDEGK